MPMAKPSARQSVERPWGWLVMVAASVTQALTHGLAASSGVFNAIFIDTVDAPAADIAWIGALAIGIMYMSGLLSSVLITKIGFRPTACIGGLITSVGMVISYFAPNIYFLYFSFGIITGVGGGVAGLAAISVVTHYFDNNRSLALGILSAGLGVGQFFLPALIRRLYDLYDWQGTFLVLGGLCLNICVCGACFRPQKNRHLARDTNDQKLLDCSVFKKCNFGVLCLNNFLNCFGLSVVYVHLVAYGESTGVDPDKSALLMSAIGLANVVGRILSGVVDHHPRMNTYILYAAAFFISGVLVTLLPAARTYPVLVAMAALFGIFSGCYGTLLASIVVQLVGLRRFSSSYGILLIFEAAGTLMGAPFAGFLFDMTHTYNISLYVGGSTLIVGSGIMAVPVYRNRETNHVKTTVEDTAENGMKETT